MADEIEEKVEEEVSEAEQKAREHGWVPKDDFKGNPDLWVNYDTYMDRSKRERVQERVIQQAADTITRLEAREKKIIEEAEKKALERLKGTMKEALAEGDEEKLNGAIEEFEKKQEPKEAYTSPEDVAVRDAWLETHPQYLRADVGTSAQAESARIISRTPGLPIQKVLEMTHEKMVKIYPEHFTNQNREKPPKVETGGVRSGGNAKTLPPEIKEEMERYAHDQAKWGVYKGKSGKGFEEDKKLAKAGYLKSYETEIVE
jgi:hypothetical protein